MPRFFFHSHNSGRDVTGSDVANMAEAKVEAVRYLGKLLCDSADDFWVSGDFEMSVTDEAGLILFTMRIVGTEAPAIRAEVPRLT